VKRQAVTGLAARARLAEDRAAHHFRLAVDANSGRLLCPPSGLAANFKNVLISFEIQEEQDTIRRHRHKLS
jgi:hypothetical protein